MSNPSQQYEADRQSLHDAVEASLTSNAAVPVLVVQEVVVEVKVVQDGRS